MSRGRSDGSSFFRKAVNSILLLIGEFAFYVSRLRIGIINYFLTSLSVCLLLFTGYGSIRWRNTQGHSLQNSRIGIQYTTALWVIVTLTSINYTINMVS